MCHEGWWRERRARRAEEERQEIWRDFEATKPADVPEVRDRPAEEIRLDTDEQEPVPAQH